MLVIGICAGLLFEQEGGWTYMSVLSDQAEYFVNDTPNGSSLPAMNATLSLVAGGVTAALRSGTFHLCKPSVWLTLRCLIGGALMGCAAAVVPGGNGALLVHGVPSLAPHAMAAYAAMTVFLCGSFAFTRKCLVISN